MIYIGVVVKEGGTDGRKSMAAKKRVRSYQAISFKHASPKICRICIPRIWNMWGYICFQEMALCECDRDAEGGRAATHGKKKENVTENRDSSENREQMFRQQRTDGFQKDL